MEVVISYAVLLVLQIFMMIMLLIIFKAYEFTESIAQLQKVLYPLII